MPGGKSRLDWGKIVACLPDDLVRRLFRKGFALRRCAFGSESLLGGYFVDHSFLLLGRRLERGNRTTGADSQG